MSASAAGASAPPTRIDQVGRGLIGNGYSIIPILPNEKRPSINDWLNVNFTQEKLSADIKKGFGKHGVGIVCGSVVAIDIDVLDQVVVKQLAGLIPEDAPCRVGRAPKALYVMRTDRDLSKLTSSIYCGENGETNAVELLAQGQQFVAYGIHPDTDEPYQWVGKDLTDTPLDDLPVFTDELWDQLCAALDRAATEKGWTLKSGRKADRKKTAPRKSAMEIAIPPLEISSDQIDAALRVLEPDADDYDFWVKVGMALHHQFEGGADGFALWDEWSSLSIKYEERETKKTWESFGPNGQYPRTFASVLELAKEKLSPKAANDNNPLLLEPWFVPKANNIPARDWLLGQTIERGVVSATVAPGGLGKSMLTLTEAVSLATDGSSRCLGNPEDVGLLGQSQLQGLKVAYINLEDTPDEQNRRARAVLDFYQVGESELQDRLFHLGEEAGFKVVKADGNHFVTCGDVELLKAMIEKYGLDAIFIDPFVSVHNVPENDNGAIDQVVKTLSDIAKQTGCAIHLVHHTSKMGDRGLSADSARGASAFSNALRSMRGISVMTKEEASRFDVSDDQRHHYKKVTSLKGNNSPGENVRWFKMESYSLGQDDEIGVPVQWTPPSPCGPELSDEQRSAIMAIFTQPGPHYRSPQGKDWVGYEIAETLKATGAQSAEKNDVVALMDLLEKEGFIQKGAVKDPTRGRDRPVWVSCSEGFETVPPETQEVE